MTEEKKCVICGERFNSIRRTNIVCDKEKCKEEYTKLKNSVRSKYIIHTDTKGKEFKSILDMTDNERNGFIKRFNDKVDISIKKNKAEMYRIKEKIK